MSKAVCVHYYTGFNNTQLTKDCGLVPYFLYKNHGFDSYMLSAKLG